MKKKEEVTKSISKNLGELSNEERLYVVNALYEYYIQYIKPIEKVEEYSTVIENAIKHDEKKIYKILKKIEKLEETKEDDNENEKLTFEQILLIVLVIGGLFSVSLGSFREVADYVGYEVIGAIVGGAAGIGIVSFKLIDLLENKKVKKINKLYSDLEELKNNRNTLENEENLIKQFSFYRRKVINTIDSIQHKKTNY